MESAVNTAKANYIRIWREVLVGWLGWSDDRFRAFVHHHEESPVGFASSMGTLHDTPLTSLITLVVPDPLYAKTGMQIGWDFLAAAGDPLRYEDQNWSEAKERVAALFASHGYSIPSGSYISNYERRITKGA